MVAWTRLRRIAQADGRQVTPNRSTMFYLVPAAPVPISPVAIAVTVSVASTVAISVTIVALAVAVSSAVAVPVAIIAIASAVAISVVPIAASSRSCRCTWVRNGRVSGTPGGTALAGVCGGRRVGRLPDGVLVGGVSPAAMCRRIVVSEAVRHTVDV